MNPAILFGQKRRRTDSADTCQNHLRLTPDETEKSEPKLVADIPKTLSANQRECPMCGSKNIEEDDGGMKCVDCKEHFRKYADAMKVQNPDYTDRQVDD